MSNINAALRQESDRKRASGVREDGGILPENAAVRQMSITSITQRTATTTASNFSSRVLRRQQDCLDSPLTTKQLASTKPIEASRYFLPFHSDSNRNKKAVLSQRLPRNAPYLSIRQYAHGLLLESPFVPSTCSTDCWAVRAKIKQKRPSRWP